MENPILTIAVPTYNGSKTIRNMLDILLPQVTKEIEVLVSDNCSTDNTKEIIAVYQEKYSCIRYIKNEKNLGADGNFLQCMKLAKGKFTMLISDDDIIIEGAIKKILSFLKDNPEIRLAYLDTVGFKNRYDGLEFCHKYKKYSPKVEKNIVTKDKKQFLSYAQRMWGFTSTFVWNTERMQSITNPEKYFNTYFLQCHIHIECSNRPDDLLGVIQGPLIAVGEYGIIGNYDTAEVEGVFYRRMIDKAIDGGYPKDQLSRYYSWKLKHLVSRAIIKEKVAGVKKTKFRNIVAATDGIFPLRIFLVSIYFMPKTLCRIILSSYRRYKGLPTETYVNRPTD